MYNIGLQVLKAKLRGFQAAGSSISHRISKSEKERKNRLWDSKRRLGTHCRNHLVAYGLLRGVPYHQIERCAPNNKPNSQVILDIMLAHADWQQKQGLDLEKVKTLLDVPAKQDAVATYVASSVTTSGNLPPSSGRLLKTSPLRLEKRP